VVKYTVTKRDVHSYQYVS